MAGAWWPLFYQGEGPRPGEFPEEFFAEAERSSSEFYKLLRIQFPPVTETLTFSPISTTLDDPDSREIGPAASKHEALADPIDSPDTATYVENELTDNVTEDRYGFDPLPPDVIGVTEIRVFTRAGTGFGSGSIEDDGPWAMALRVGSTNYFEDQLEPNRFFNVAYRTNVMRFTANPDTLAAWEPAEFDALEVALFCQPDGKGVGFGNRHTQLYIEVDVTRIRRGQYSDSPVNSRSEGLYLNRVLEWGTIRYSAEGFDVDRVSTWARIADPDNELGAIFAGKDGEEARGALTDLRYASPDITDKTKWYTAFDGVLKSWEEVEPRIWELRFRTDDDGIDSEVPRTKYTEFDFPDADATIFSNTVQVLYGVQNAFGLTDDGAVGCPDVDKVRFRRFVSLGIMKSVIRVFSKAGRDDPVVERMAGFASGTAATAGYQIIFPIINGRQFTLIEFNVAGMGEAELFEELEITCDVEGIEDVGDGTGIIIRNADAIAHFYSNFVKANYQSGLWFPPDPRLDEDSFISVQTFLNNLGQDTSRRIGGESRARKAKDELADWCFQLRIKMFWDENGKLVVREFSPFTLEVYKDEPAWIREGLHDITEGSYEVDDTGIKQQVFVNYIDRSASGDFLANIEVRDFELDGDEAETIEATWFRSALPEAT